MLNIFKIKIFCYKVVNQVYCLKNRALIITMKQTTALTILKTGQNVFLTGQPGAGKTHTINSYVNWLISQGIDVAVTASTGIAATHIGGMTIHSWSGLGIRKMLTERDLSKLKETASVRRRVCRASVLIIDEVSMLEAQLLDSLNRICKYVRDNQSPFGGLQIVLVGDFFQLPPVNKNNQEIKFAFSAEAWQEANFKICYLTEQYRHDDKNLSQVLLQIRQADVSLEAVYEKLSKCLVDDQAQPEIDELTSRLFSHNVDVDRLNEDLLKKIDNQERVFNMTGRGATTVLANLKRSCLSPETLKLKIGARVMFTKNNYERNYINGMLGEVIDFDENERWPIVRLANAEEMVVYPDEWLVSDGASTIARISQVPLRLAWAMTVHKSQGMTLDSAIIDLTNAFAFGQGYVALSRVRSFSGLKIIGLNRRALEVDPVIKLHDQQLKQLSVNIEADLAGTRQNELDLLTRQFISSCGGTGKPKEKKKAREKGSTHEATLKLLKENNYSIAKVAGLRNVTPGTIFGHVEELYIKEKLFKEEVLKMIPEELIRTLPKIISVFDELNTESLSPVYNYFNGQYSYEVIRMARLIRQVNNG